MENWFEMKQTQIKSTRAVKIGFRCLLNIELIRTEEAGWYLRGLVIALGKAHSPRLHICKCLCSQGKVSLIQCTTVLRRRELVSIHLIHEQYRSGLRVGVCPLAQNLTDIKAKKLSQASGKNSNTMCVVWPRINQHGHGGRILETLLVESSEW